MITAKRQFNVENYVVSAQIPACLMQIPAFLGAVSYVFQTFVVSGIVVTYNVGAVIEVIGDIRVRGTGFGSLVANQ